MSSVQITVFPEGRESIRYLSIEEDKATNEINDSPSLESSEEMTTDTLLLRIFKKLITESEEDKAAKMIYHDYPFEKRFKEKILAVIEADKAVNAISSLLGLLDKLAIEDFDAAKESTFEEYYERSDIDVDYYGESIEIGAKNVTPKDFKKILNQGIYELLEWISYTKLRNIKKITVGGFGIVYKGVWLDGLISHWDYEKQDWKRVTHELNE
uniref:Protein kinase domain-containing protein n=1 Tax=Rhizophagus irregularis (strain DAOM 181602 / DAOM 197198 / MUCL 43194) TaxID=747089 RepID=U9T761_RHIID